jgi:hypothetical protein
MECHNYGKIDDFEDLISKAITDAKTAGKAHNFLIQAQFDRELVFSDQLSSCATIASQWQLIDVPENLYFTHGHYIQTGGIAHIIEELKAKPTSNRALYSLISQKHIINSLDKPIPSFMILQCAIENDVLYCSAHFRALEVSEFLKINIAEIKLVLSHILKEFTDIKEVTMAVSSFTAYVTEGFSVLQRPKIDFMPPEEIPALIIETPEKIGSLLEEKSRPSSVIETKSLLALRRVIETKAYINTVNESLNRTRIISLLEDAIQKGTDLADLRRRHSKHDEVDKLETAFIECLKATAKEFKK